MTNRNLFLSVALVLAAVAPGCHKSDEKPAKVQAAKPEPIPVRTLAVEQIQVDRRISVTGSLFADETATVTSEVPGRILSLPVDFGSVVTKGQVVAQIDPRELQISVDRTKASLAQALARIGLSPDQGNERPDSSPSVRLAQSQFEDAKSKYDRAATLVKSGDIPEERAIEAEKLYRGREAALQQAKDDLRTQLALIQSIQAELRLAEKRLSDATVRAPFDGVVTDRPVSPGQFIKDVNVLMTITKTRPLRLRIEVPEDASGLVRPGTSVSFTTDAAPGQEFQTQITRLDARLNPQSRVLTAEARVNINDARLRPGVFVTVSLISQRNVNVPAVSESAVLRIAGLNKIYVVGNGKASERRVPPGEIRNGKMELPGDIPPGTLVAVSNLGRLSNGADIRVEAK
jgi:RND family efflux transporter MFP subunit